MGNNDQTISPIEKHQLCAGHSEARTEAGTGSFLGRYEPVKIACPGDLKRRVGQAIIIAKYVEKLIDNKRLPYGL